MSRREQRVARLLRLRAVEVDHAKAALARAAVAEREAREVEARAHQGLDRARADLRTREQAGSTGHDLRVCSTLVPTATVQVSAARAEVERRAPDTLRAREALLEARRRCESLERWKQRLAGERCERESHAEQRENDEVAVRSRQVREVLS